jgi:glycosyltransferase involved in cell wall biosynthesis
LNEAVESVLAYKGEYSYEIIIVDDGSTNVSTIALLDEFKRKDILLICQDNRGPSDARNNGVKHSSGEFLLCLDSDNRINPRYIDEGVNVLRNNPGVGVVYARPEFTGDRTRTAFITGPFKIERLLVESYIDMCAVIRKKAWEDIGGLDEYLRQHEDWEFWVRMYKAGWQFMYIDKILFQYRMRAGSLITQAQDDGNKKMISYLYTKHWDLLYDVFYKLYGTSIIYANDRKRPFRSFVKYLLKPTQNNSF